jgi:hypothetical protein
MPQEAPGVRAPRRHEPPTQFVDVGPLTTAKLCRISAASHLSLHCQDHEKLFRETKSTFQIRVHAHVHVYMHVYMHMCNF